jgi:hypothetical protein
MKLLGNSGEKIPKLSLLFLGSLCLLFLVAEIINNRFWLSDFEVYYNAAKRILHSENLYRIQSDGHYIFKYSPTSAVYFIPFTLLPFEIAKYIYWILLSFIIVSAFYVSVKLLSFYKPCSKLNAIVFAGSVILAIHYLRELHLGQVNYVLLFLYILSIYFYIENKTIYYSAVLAISIFIKPFTLLFIPYLIVKKKYKELMWFFAFCIVLALVPFLFYGTIETTLNQYAMWINELKIELSHKQGLLNYSNHTIFSVIARYSPLKYVEFNETTSRIYQMTLLIIIGISVIWFMKINDSIKNIEQQKFNSILEISLLVSIIPLLAFTSENAFIFSQLLVFAVLLNFQLLNKLEKIIAVLSFILIGGNFSELIGSDLSQRIDNLSLISVGVILLIVLLFKIRTRAKIAPSSNF